MQKISVLVADDHAVLRQGLQALLQTHAEIEVVGEAQDGREAVTQACELEPDVVLMDIGMPLMDGIEATRQIKRECPGVQVLALTIHDNEEYLFQFLEVGGSGYLLKKAGLNELVAAIRTVSQGETWLSPSLTGALVKDYLARGHKGGRRGTSDGLTPREREVLKLIAEGYSTEKIASLLHRSGKTIETHRTHIMEKLGLHDRVELVKYAIRRGLIDP